MIATIVALLASLIGAISGIGGGVIIKPLLDLSGNYSTAAISILSSATVFSMSLSSVMKHINLKTPINKKLSTWIALGSVLGGILGQNILTFIMEQSTLPIKQIQNLILMILLILVLLYMNKLKYKYHWNFTNPLLFFVVGLVFGMVATFVGIGGGPINLVALTMFFSMGPKEASVTSIIMILFSQSSKLIQVGLAGDFMKYDLSILLFMIPAAIVGGLLGAKLNRKFTDKQIHLLFNVVMVFIIFTTCINLFAK
ncbi:sulfite exporter TauE/SafE family protein [Anaerorhabdus sp.]|uniref:sulfite exporter TauE/SafE family protein n=1 Tax=Anaerorhabdus sp. TaxID=1872524 RepID=UPI002FCA287D